MKPEGWDELSQDRKREFAEELVNTLRGRFIIAQALALGMKALKSVPMELRERSNIEDMEMLREMIFNFPIAEDLPTRPTLVKG